MSADTRAQVHLTASLSLNPDDSLKHVKIAAGRVKGGGASLLTTGLQNIGAQVNVERESNGHLELSITSGNRLVELCTLSAVASVEPDGRTTVRVGGLGRYKTTQSTVLGFIPVGPKMIAGYGPYKKFLDEVRAELTTADPSGSITVVGA